jgi:ubiquinone/menaquinone biosynthesis C-methylase UbiE
VNKVPKQSDDMMDASERKKRESQAWGKADFDEIVHASAKSSHVISALLQKRSIQNFDLRNKYVINVGGGYGEEAEFLLKRGAAMVALVDIAPAQLRHSSIRKQKHHLDGLECIRGDAENIPFKDDSFDLGYVHMALHHFSSHEQCISEVCRVSREVVFVDIMNPLITRVVTKLGFYKDEDGIVPNRLNGKDVENLLMHQELIPKTTYFFVAPVGTYNLFLTRCWILLFKTINSVISRSEAFGLLFGNVAIISGTKS